MYGHVRDADCRLAGVPMGGILGDQQAALVGQTWDPNPDPNKPRPHVKVTYGTGAFLLWDIGENPSFSPYGLLTTIAYQMGPNAEVHYALEVREMNERSQKRFLRRLQASILLISRTIDVLLLSLTT